MLAIPISKGALVAKTFSAWRICAFRHCVRLSKPAAFAAIFFVSTSLFAAGTNQNVANPASLKADRTNRVWAAFGQARSHYQSGTNHAEAAWQFARACFDAANVATNNAERAAIAEQGIAASRELLKTNPAIAAAHYYLGMDLGRLADTRRNLSGLKIVKEMEREFEEARNLDEHFDNAGPDRNLGLLYEQAPAVISIGSRSKALQHLRRAVELAPAYPENGLNLIEADIKWGDYDEARREFSALESSSAESHKQFDGDDFNWADWDARLAKARAKLALRRHASY